MKASFYEGGKVNSKLFGRFAKEVTDVKAGELSVLQMLIYFSNEKGECWPRLNKLARACNIHERYVRILMRRLIAKGYVLVLQEATPYAPGFYSVRIPEGRDAEKDMVYHAQNGGGDAEKYHGALFKCVPGEAGTKINPIINNKGLTLKREVEKEKSTMTFKKCAVKGCTLMGVGEFCRKHTRKGSRSNL